MKEVRRVWRCPYCGFTAERRDAFGLIRRLPYGKNERECPDCGDAVAFL